MTATSSPSIAADSTSPETLLIVSCPSAPIRWRISLGSGSAPGSLIHLPITSGCCCAAASCVVPRLACACSVSRCLTSPVRHGVPRPPARPRLRDAPGARGAPASSPDRRLASPASAGRGGSGGIGAPSARSNARSKPRRDCARLGTRLRALAPARAGCPASVGTTPAARTARG